MKNMYAFSTTQLAQYKRLGSLTHPLWIDAMVLLVSRRGPYFRWHDSGDIQDIEHLSRIVSVARRTPKVAHWLPTREDRTVKTWRRLYGEFPSNLTIRISAHMVDGQPREIGLPTSTVTSGTASCPAKTQNNECQDCRACWDGGVANVSYAYH